MQSNNGEKYFSRACIEATLVDTSLRAAVYKRCIPKPKEKTLNTTIYIRRCGDNREEMQVSAYYS